MGEEITIEKAKVKAKEYYDLEPDCKQGIEWINWFQLLIDMHESIMSEENNQATIKPYKLLSQK